MTKEQLIPLVGELHEQIIQTEKRTAAEIKELQQQISLQIGVIQNANAERIKLLGGFLCRLIAVNNDEEFETVLARHHNAISSGKTDHAYVKAVIGD